MLGVIEMHRDAVGEIDPACPEELRTAARLVWDECLASGRRNGYRNAQVTVLAPTGTIAFMMDCDTTGIEPDIALVKYKQLAGGGMMKMVNHTVPAALHALAYDAAAADRIVRYVDQHDTIEGAARSQGGTPAGFRLRFRPKGGKRSLHWKAHVRMIAAAQPFLSGAISKTVNMPQDSTAEDIENAYLEAWRMGLKAIAIYRDGSKQSQPVATARDKSGKNGASNNLAGESGPRKTAAERHALRRRLLTTRESRTHTFSVGGFEGYLTVGLFEDGSPGELFVIMSKEGSTVGGLMNVVGAATSLGLQFGVPLGVLVDKFSYTRFEPSGWTTNSEIPHATSVVDYIFRWLGIQFIPGYREANTPQFPAEAGQQTAGSTASSHIAGPHGVGSYSGGDGKSAGALSGPLPLTPPSASEAHQNEPAGDDPDEEDETGLGLQSRQFTHFQADAPPAITAAPLRCATATVICAITADTAWAAASASRCPAHGVAVASPDASVGRLTKRPNNSARERTSNSLYIFRTCECTVCRLIPRQRAISFSASPGSSRSKTRRSAAERGSLWNWEEVISTASPTLSVSASALT